MQLPKNRSELCIQIHHTAFEKTLDRLSGFCKHAPMRGKAGRLDRKNETGRRFPRPLAEALSLLRPIERAVDLDGRYAAACIFELASLGQVFRIELAAPGRKNPAADADADHSARKVTCTPARFVRGPAQAL